MQQGTWQEGWRQSTAFVPVHRPDISYMNLNMSARQEEEEEEEVAEDKETEPSLDEMSGDVMEDLLLPVHNEDEFWDDNYMFAMTEAMTGLLDDDNNDVDLEEDEDSEDEENQDPADQASAAADQASAAEIENMPQQPIKEDNCCGGQPPCESPTSSCSRTTVSTIRLTTTRSGRFPVPPPSYWPAGHNFDDMKLSRVYLLREIREKKMHCQARREMLIRTELERIYMHWHAEAITEDRLRTQIIQSQKRVKGLRQRETSNFLSWEEEATRLGPGPGADVDHDDGPPPLETEHFWEDD